MNLPLKVIASVFLAGLPWASLPVKAEEAASRSAPVSAFEILDQVRAAYDRLEVYTDSGSIEVVDRRAEKVEAARYTFGTWKLANDGFRFDVDRSTTLWETAGRVRRFDRRAREVYAISDLQTALRDGTEMDSAALLVPRLLAGDRDALIEPEAATLSGPDPCGDSSCWSLEMTADGEAVRYLLWIDTESLLIRYLKLERFDPKDLVTLALRGEAAAPASTLRVRYDITAAGRSAADDTSMVAAVHFQPPTGTRHVVRRAVGATPTTESGVDPTVSQASDLGFGESISVQLRTLSLRVIDSRGHSITDLEPSDFILQIGRETVPVESVDWVSSATPSPLAGQSPAELAAADIVLPAPGKLVVLFVQSDLHPSRAWGQLKILDQIPGILETLHRDDQVAVVAFDSHLKLHLDFTRDTSLVQDAVFQGIRGADDSWPRDSRYPSLARHLDEREAQRAATPERALELTAQAMAPFSNEDKVVLFLGWGLGRYGAFGVSETYAFRQAETALKQAGIPVFVLDITEADYHSLEVGLEEMAHATGGAYLKTYLFPEQAANRIAATMEGYYRIYYAPPETSSKGQPRIKVRLAHRKATVLLSPGGG